LRGITLRNRLVFAAHLTNYAVHGRPTERHAAYYAARAAGGAALVITEEHSVHPDDRPYEKLIRGHDPAALPGYRLITSAVHRHGAVVLAQLNHNGGQSTGKYSRRPVLAPSAIPDPMFREVPVAATGGQIAALVECYADVAARCVEGGFDGVELQCSHASIVRQFLLPATNTRTDGYGGSPERRARFLLELIGSVRAAIGPDRVLGVRLGRDSPDSGLAELVRTARLVAGTGEVDYLNSSVGVAGSSQWLITPPMGEPAGYALAGSSAMRAATGLPVLGIGRFTSREQAEQALAEERCDLVGVVRGHISDPDFATSRRPRVCLGCNQECVGRVGMNLALGCVQNPRAGREAAPTARPTRSLRRGRRVLVVGGGPAGLRAAATAAARGHRVTLCEATETLGGQLVLAAGAPGRAELGLAVANLRAECTEAGVRIRTGVTVDPALLTEFAPDAVVLATGSRAAPPPWCATALDVRDALAGRVEPRGEILVYDELGDHQGSSVALLLAERGAKVTLLTPAMVAAQGLGLTLDRERFRRRAAAVGLRTETDRVVLGAAVAEDELIVTVLHHPTGASQRRRYRAVVCAVPAEPVDELWPPLRDSGLPTHRIGDCLAPRHLAAAITDAHRIASTL
jgi:2,4-dienoyl-CoA reductase (NADPH2)